MKLRGVLFRLLAILGSLVALEILLIVGEPWIFRGHYQYDPDLGFRGRPHYKMRSGRVTNRFGFNDRDYPLERTTDTFRILAVGDSFNWAGAPLDRDYSALLEESFRAHYGEAIEVINCGYAMTSTDQQLAMLRKYGFQYKPDLVVLGFFMGNDFMDAAPDRMRIVVNDILLSVDRKTFRTFLGYPLVPRSRLVGFLSQKVRVVWELWKGARDLPEADYASNRGHRVWSKETFLAIERARLRQFSIAGLRAGEMETRIRNVLSSLASMKTEVEQRGGNLVVAIFPTEMQVYPRLFEEVATWSDLSVSDYDLEQLNRVLEEFMDAEGIRYVDLLSAFRERGPQESLYLLRNTHWNPAGHALAAELLYEFLLPVVEEWQEHSRRATSAEQRSLAGVSPARSPTTAP